MVDLPHFKYDSRYSHCTHALSTINKKRLLDFILLCLDANNDVDDDGDDDDSCNDDGSERI